MSKLKIGCYLDQGNYTINELNRAVIRIAESFGFKPDLTETDPDTEQGEMDDILEWESENAIEFLNDCPESTLPYCYWAHDGEAGAFGLWRSVDSAKESVEFVSSKDDDYPPEDFRGEWLHINDHGNCTLFARAEDGQDAEIWGIV